MITGDNTWLVTGGAGYIGAHVVRSLLAADLDVVVVDNFSTGIKERIPDSVKLIEADCADHYMIREVLLAHRVVGVLHLASYKHARESSHEPLRYWHNNVGAMLGLVQAMKGTSVRYFIFSSSCSVYGASGPVTESTPAQPLSPYARTKYACELLLEDVAPELGISSMILRYFNVIGNDNFYMAHDTSTECLLPAAYAKVHRDLAVNVFGVNLPTPDGTALRDYVDVRDLARAHAAAAAHLMAQGMETHLTLNVGIGTPTSVQQILHTLGQEVGRTITIEDCAANTAEPPAIWAESPEAHSTLQWQPKHSLISSIQAHHRSVQTLCTPPCT